MQYGTLSGRRVLVVGASSGIGYAIARGTARGGARTMAVARRLDRLEELAANTDGAIAIARCDVREDADCARVVEEAVSLFGGLDAVVYATGTAAAGALVDIEGDTWREAFETNVVGAALICRAAVPHLTSSDGRMVFLSSVSSGDARPYLVPYCTSKAALDAMIHGWRNEHPNLCFIRVLVGPTGPTEFGAHWKPAAREEYARIRKQRYFTRSGALTTDEQAAEVIHTLVSPAWLEDITTMPANQT